MPTYAKAEKNDTVLHVLAGVMESPEHKRLADAGVTITVMYAYAKKDDDGNSVGPALKLHGSPCWAIVKINSLKLRVEGFSDATIFIDGDRWIECSEARQSAILSHEATHLEPTGDTDDAGRPKLKMRMHDAELGLFYDVIEKHGLEEPQAEAFVAIHKKMTQLKLPWG